MRRSGIIALVALALGCRPRTTTTTPQPQQGYYPPPGYYPPQQPQPGYYPPPQPSSTAQPQPVPQQPQPAPQPQPSSQPGNPWVNLLGHLLSNAPPLPPFPFPTPSPSPSPTPPTPPPPSVNARGLELANAINTYRAQNGLPAIPISKALSQVAETHVADLRDSPKVDATCNGHSWTSKGPWTPCCYTADHAQAKCMWQKPAEITSFKATGFEITLGQPGEKNAGTVLDSGKAVSAWQQSPLHNDVILNKGQWQKVPWKAMGAGIIDSHACAWFSDQADPTH